MSLTSRCVAGASSEALDLEDREADRARAERRGFQLAQEFEMSTKPKFGLVQTRPLDELRLAPENAHIYDAIATDTPAIRDMARSMRERGVLEPIAVSSDGFILSGHRRHVAARLAGLKKVPVRPYSIKRGDPDFLKVLVEFNAQRIKSAETLMREAAVKIDPKKARERLANEREMKIFESIWGRDLQTIESDDDGRRPILSDAKTPLLNAIIRVALEIHSTDENRVQ